MGVSGIGTVLTTCSLSEPAHLVAYSVQTSSPFLLVPAEGQFVSEQPASARASPACNYPLLRPFQLTSCCKHAFLVMMF